MIAKVFSVSPASGKKGQTATNITPSVYTGRLAHSEQIEYATADDPAVKKIVSINLAGNGDRYVSPLFFIDDTNKGAGENGVLSNVSVSKDTHSVKITGKTNAASILLACNAGNILLTQNIQIKIKALTASTFKWLKSDGGVSDTEVTISHNFAVGSGHPLSGDPGAEQEYFFEIFGIKIPASVDAENRNIMITVGADAIVSPGKGMTLGMIQTGATPTISADKVTLNFTPENLAAQTVNITSNDDWTARVL